MPKAKELTSTQAAFLADYRNALTATAELEANRLQAYRDLYMAGSLAVSAGVTYSRGAKEAGVSVGTFAKHVFAYPLVPTVSDWVMACEALELDPVTLPHVLVGRAVDAGVSTDALRAIGDAVGKSIDEEGVEPSLAIITAVKALDRAAAAARKAKREQDAANNDESDSEPDEESGSEPGDDSTIEVQSQWLVVARDLAVLAGKVHKAGIPSELEHNAVMDAIRAYLNAAKARQTSAA